jgi:hypothetical protein
VTICVLILTTGMLAIAALLALTTQMHLGAREGARSMRLAQERVDELLKMDFDDDPEVAVGGSLTANVADHFVTNPLDMNGDALNGITVRWAVAAGPTANGQPTDTRIVTVRVINLRAQQYRQTDLTTIIRSWQ